MRTYKGYKLIDVSSPTDDGRYQARAAIVSYSDERMRWQRFLDLEIYKTKEEAEERAFSAAMVWIDKPPRQESLALPTNFSALD